MKQCIAMIFITSFLLIPQGVRGQLSGFDRESYANEEYEKVMENFREAPVGGRAIKIRDLVEVIGEDRVKLTGFGVVSGLNGTGDKSAAAVDMLLEVARKQGIRISPSNVSAGNLALVSLSAVVSPHQRTFDVAVKSVSDAKSLQNGYLEASTLGPVGSPDTYAVASGALALGARYFEAEAGGAGGNGTATSVTIGHPTAGYVISGGELIKEIPYNRLENGEITLFLKYPDDRTSANIADAISRYMGMIGIQAEPENASNIVVRIPPQYYKISGDITRIIADIGDLPTTVSRDAVITIDQGSGVIAMTEGVKMEPGSIAVAGLTVTVSSDITPVTRQGLFDGETDFIETPQLEVSQGQANFLSIPAGTDLRKVQETLNALKLTPTSIVSVFNAMHKAGMIHARIIVMPR